MDAVAEEDRAEALELDRVGVGLDEVDHDPADRLLKTGSAGGVRQLYALLHAMRSARIWPECWKGMGPANLHVSLAAVACQRSGWDGLPQAA